MLYTFESADGKSRIVFDTSFRSGLTDAYARKLTAAIKAAHKLDPLEIEVLEVYSWLLTTTRRIEIQHDGPLNDALAAFQVFVNWARANLYLIQASESGAESWVGLTSDESILAEVWPRMQAGVSNILQNEWYAAVNAAQIVFAAPAALAPLPLLTEAQKGDPDFLVQGAPRVKKSVTRRTKRQQPDTRKRQ